MPYDPERHGPRRVVGPGFHERVYEAVLRVPAGSVTTFGDVAKALGLATASRHVGFALAALGRNGRGEEVPWFRVVNGRGRVACTGGEAPGRCEQAERLRAEGVPVDETGRITGFRSLRFDHGFAGAGDA